jgi:hypothetical protein
MARLESRGGGGAFLPPSDRVPLGVDESLLKDVIEDTLVVEPARPIADIDQLGRRRLLSTRHLVVRNPMSRTTMGAGGHWYVGVEREEGRSWGVRKRSCHSRLE